MTTDEIKKLVDRAQKLQKGVSSAPWYQWGDGVYAGKPTEKRPGYLSGFETQVVEMDEDFNDSPKRVVRANKRFICQSRTLLPNLAEACEELMREIEVRDNAIELSSEMGYKSQLEVMEEQTEKWRAELAEVARERDVALQALIDNAVVICPTECDKPYGAYLVEEGYCDDCAAAAAYAIAEAELEAKDGR